MANLMVYPRFKAWDTDGTPLASGKVYTYVTGTSTPATTYTNGGGGTSNANPVILDANGEADIWGSPGTIYRIVVKNSADATLQTIDNVSPITPSSTLLGNLNTNGYSITSSGSNNITLTPGGSGAVVLDGLTWPTADGTNGQVIKTNGSGALSFVGASTDLVNDTSPQLGGALDANTYSIAFDNGTGILDESSNEQILFTTTSSAVNYTNITNAVTGQSPIIAAAGSDTNIDLKLAGKGTGTVKLNNISYPTADGTANQVIVTNGSGTLSFSSASSTLKQRAYATSTTVTTCSTAIPADNTIPQNTEGNEVITCAITPGSASTTLIIRCVIPIATNTHASKYVTAALFQDSTAGALAATAQFRVAAAETRSIVLEHKMTSGTTSATTFKVRVGPDANTVYTLADSAGTRLFGGVATIVMTIDEVS